MSPIERLKGALPDKPELDGDTVVQSADLREVIRQAMRDEQAEREIAE